MPQYPSAANYISVNYSTAATYGTTGSYNAFDTTNYGGATTTIANNTIEYDSTNGKFTVKEAGFYKIIVPLYMTVGATGFLSLEIEHNGVRVGYAGPGVYSFADPVERTLMAGVEMNAGDVIAVPVTSSAGVVLQLRTGTCFNMWKID